MGPLGRPKVQPQKSDCGARIPGNPDSDDRQASRVALRGFTDNQSNEALVKKAMTTKYPSSLVLLELAEELAAKKCDLSLAWIRRDLNQLADDLTNEKFDSFDPEFRVPLKGEDMRWRVLDKLLNCADNFYSELKKRKAPVGCAREIARDKRGRYLLGRYRDRPSVQKGTVLSALTSTSGGASGLVVGYRE